MDFGQDYTSDEEYDDLTITMMNEYAKKLRYRKGQ